MKILNVAEYRDLFASAGGSLARDSYNRERLLMLNQLKVERNSVKKEIKRLNENTNKKAIEFIDDMKLVIRLEDGKKICVTCDTVVGTVDSINTRSSDSKIRKNT